MMKKISLPLIILMMIALSKAGYSQFTGVFTGKPTYDLFMVRNGSHIGTINIELFPNIAPMHVRNFDSLVSEQFYDSTAFHRVIPGFMIQGGDPNSRHGDISTWGYGDPSQPTGNAEFSVAKHLRGILSAARDTDVNSANSQFFICVAAASWLNGQYSVYGKVTNGMNIVDTIVNAPRDANDNPLQKIEMFVTRTGSNDSVPVAPTLNLPASGTTVVGTSKILRWFAVTDAIYYHIEVSTDSLFSTLFRSVDVAAIVYNATSLSPNTTYYWRVRTNNGGHNSTYSQVWNFNTNSSTGIETSEEKDALVVYPNPSKGQFCFNNIGLDCKIEIYDISGKLIKSVENTDMIDLSGNQKGTYYYRIIRNTTELHSGQIILQ